MVLGIIANCFWHKRDALMISKVNFIVYQGADFRRVLELRDEAGALINLDGYEFKGQLRESYGSKLILDIVFSIRDQIEFTGIVDMHIPSNVTTILGITKPFEYIYDIEMTDAASEVRRVMEGKVKIFPEVTK